MEYTRSGNESIAHARGFSTAAEMRAYYERNGYPGARKRETRESEEEAHTRTLETAARLRDRIAAHAPSARSDVLAAELATANTKAERRDAVNRFMAAQRSPEEAREEARFHAFLRSPGHERAYEARFAPQQESALGQGGAIVPPRFSAAVIHAAKEFSNLLRDFEVWESAHGETYTRATYSQFSPGQAQTENTNWTQGPAVTYGQQSWGYCPTYVADYTATYQLLRDSFAYPDAAEGSGFNSDSYLRPDVNGAVGGFPQSAPVVKPTSAAAFAAHVAAVLGEGIGRAIAPAATAVFAAISAQGAWAAGNSGGYV